MYVGVCGSVGSGAVQVSGQASINGSSSSSSNSDRSDRAHQSCRYNQAARMDKSVLYCIVDGRAAAVAAIAAAGRHAAYNAAAANAQCQ